MEFYYHEADRDILVLRADGGLNHRTAAQFQAELERLVDAGLRKIIVDCSRLDHVSSYGLGVLIGIHNRLRKRGET